MLLLSKRSSSLVPPLDMPSDSESFDDISPASANSVSSAESRFFCLSPTRNVMTKDELQAKAWSYYLEVTKYNGCTTEESSMESLWDDGMHLLVGFFKNASDPVPNYLIDLLKMALQKIIIADFRDPNAIDRRLFEHSVTSDGLLESCVGCSQKLRLEYLRDYPSSKEAELLEAALVKAFGNFDADQSEQAKNAKAVLDVNDITLESLKESLLNQKTPSVVTSEEDLEEDSEDEYGDVSSSEVEDEDDVSEVAFGNIDDHYDSEADLFSYGEDDCD